MQRSQSEPSLVDTHKSSIQGHISGAIPGYQGHVPGARSDPAVQIGTFAETVRQCKTIRSKPHYDHQAVRLGIEADDFRRRTRAEPSLAPLYDKRGVGYQPAGDVTYSRMPPAGEIPAYRHSDLGLTSASFEGRGGANLRGYGSAARSIPGFRGFVPGRHAENVIGMGWSKTNEQSISSHLTSRQKGMRTKSLVVDGGTLVPTAVTDSQPEVPLYSLSYNDQVRGSSTCEFTGSKVDPAGRLAPCGKQEDFGLIRPTPHPVIHGYAGCVPGRVGENVIGERQCKTNTLANKLWRKQRMRITQR
mmetsp:Transcript_11765/g.21416  ORF Transcript_11765/g.21416 Transcript_11765/m.21416 type:complete len:303 (-) Transcript_11765:192-1100(-)